MDEVEHEELPARGTLPSGLAGCEEARGTTPGPAPAAYRDGVQAPVSVRKHKTPRVMCDRCGFRFRAKKDGTPVLHRIYYAGQPVYCGEEPTR